MSQARDWPLSSAENCNRSARFSSPGRPNLVQGVAILHSECPTVLGDSRFSCCCHRTDFLLTRKRTSDELGLLTLDNRQVFLYNRTAYDVRYAALGDPVLEGGRGWRVHRVGNWLIYTTGEACDAREGFRNEPRFFLEFPAAGEDAGVRHARQFRFQGRMFEVAGRCVAELSVSDVAKFRTGQFVRGEEAPLWSEEWAFRK